MDGTTSDALNDPARSVSPSTMQILSGIGGLLLLVFIWIQTVDYLQRRRLPPGPRGWPVIGNLLELGGKPHLRLVELAQKYGPLMYLQLGSCPTIVVSSPEMSEEILKTHDPIFANRPPSIMGQIFFYNHQDMLTAPLGPLWRGLRRLAASELFSPAPLAANGVVRRMYLMKALQSMLQEGSKGELSNLYRRTTEINFNNITHMLFGKGCYGVKIRTEHSGHGGEEKELDEMLEEVPVAAGRLVLSEFIPWLRWLDSGDLQKTFLRLRSECADFLGQILEEHRRTRDKAGEARDITDKFLEIQIGGGSGEKYSDDVIKANLVSLIIGGTDTSSTQTQWMFSEIFRHPEVHLKVVEELDRVIGKERLVEEADIDNLPYLQAVLMEVFRMHPIGPLLAPHYSSEAVTVKGYHIPKNTRVIINLYSISRSPDLWENPEKFDPSRFFDKSLDHMAKGLDFRVLPFGSGRRKCPGANLGVLVVPLVVATVLHACDVRLPEGSKPQHLDMEEQFGMVTNRKNPLRVRISPRLPAHAYAAAGINLS